MGSSPSPFPKLYAVIKWTIVGALALLAVAAAVFWTMVLGGFAGSGFHARPRAIGAADEVVVTPECAWPYRTDEPEAKAVCRVFYNLSPQERAEVVKARK